jgi:hypothetical protein
MGPPGKNASHCADLEDEDSLHKLKLCDVSKKKNFLSAKMETSSDEVEKEHCQLTVRF